MESRDWAIAVAIFFVSAALGFSVGGSLEDGRGDIAFPDAQVNSSQEIATAYFFNRSIDLFHEEGSNATFYIDRDRDGSADITLETSLRDGSIHRFSRPLEIEGSSYRLTFEYSDDAGKEEDAWLKLVSAERL